MFSKDEILLRAYMAAIVFFSEDNLVQALVHAALLVAVYPAYISGTPFFIIYPIMRKSSA